MPMWVPMCLCLVVPARYIYTASELGTHEQRSLARNRFGRRNPAVGSRAKLMSTFVVRIFLIYGNRAGKYRDITTKGCVRACVRLQFGKINDTKFNEGPSNPRNYSQKWLQLVACGKWLVITFGTLILFSTTRVVVICRSSVTLDPRFMIINVILVITGCRKSSGK